MKSLTHILSSTVKKVTCTILLSIASCLALADYTMNMSPGVSEISRRTYHLHMTIFWICVVIGIVVFGVLIYALIMHRKSIGHKAHDFHENTVIEIIWTIIPFIILISMAVPATSVLKFIDDKSNSDILIKITGFQWRWQYEYPEHDISFFSNLLTPQEQIDNKEAKDANYLREVDNPLVLPIGKKIRFLFTANDVIHSWWVPQLGIKKDTVPGFINESWVIIDKPGVYHGQCTELCGARHGYMPIVVDAKTPEEYQKWIESKKKKPEAAKPADATTNATTPDASNTKTLDKSEPTAGPGESVKDADPIKPSDPAQVTPKTDAVDAVDVKQIPKKEETAVPTGKKSAPKKAPLAPVEEPAAQDKKSATDKSNSSVEQPTE